MATLTNATLSVGSNVIRAVYAPIIAPNTDFKDSTNSVTQIVNKAGTTNAIVSLTNPTVFGQTASFMVTVSATAPGVGTPTGTVTFYNGATSLGMKTLTDGETSLTITNLAVGTNLITAIYAGNTNFLGSTNSVTQTVAKDMTTNTLASSVNPTVFGQPTTFTATVSAKTPGAGTPTGTVSFYDGTPVVTTNLIGMNTLVNGMATLTVSNLAVGTHSIMLLYSGDKNFTNGGSLVVITQMVNQAATTNEIISAVNPTVFGQPAVFTVTVGAAAPGAGLPTGTVIFYYDNTNSFATNTLVAGVTSVTNASLAVGTNPITAIYSGDGNFDGSMSATNQVVNQAATTNAIVSAINPMVFGQSAIFRATVCAVSPGVGVPTGTMAFFNGTTLLGTETLTNGETALTTASLAVGTNSITAIYSGDENFLGSTNCLMQTVNKACTTNGIISIINPTVFGQPAVFTVTVGATAPGAGLPTGTVAFFNGTTNFGANILINGVTSVTNASLAVGTNPITAVYAGDGNFIGSTSSTNQVVDRAATTNVLVSSVNPAVAGQAVVFTATVSADAPGAGLPTGAMTFFNGTNDLGTNLLVNGVASLTNSILPAGTNLITAVYAGNTNFIGSMSLVVPQMVLSLNTNTQVLAPSVVDDTNLVFLQTGLMQQNITVSNVTSSAYSAVRITLHFSPAQTNLGIIVFDATGMDTNGNPYLQSNFPVPPHGSVTFAVQYYVPDETTIPTPTITVTLVTAQLPPIPSGTSEPVVQKALLPVGNTFLVGFMTVKNANYYILYSSDLVNWFVVEPAIAGTGTEVQWLDTGPPQTQTPGAQRFYRVIKANQIP